MSILRDDIRQAVEANLRFIFKDGDHACDHLSFDLTEAIERHLDHYESTPAVKSGAVIIDDPVRFSRALSVSVALASFARLNSVRMTDREDEDQRAMRGMRQFAMLLAVESGDKG